MTIKGLIFDINGTLTDIHTDEWHEDVYRVLSNLLSYQGILLEPKAVRDLYFQLMKEQRAASTERYFEFGAIEIFRKIVTLHASELTQGLPAEKLAQLPLFLAETHRAASRFRLQLYPGVANTIRQLHENYHLAIISDGQSAYAIPELNAVGLSGYFEPIVISGQLGYRKPDERLFSAVLAAMQLESSQVLFIGNDMHRDIYGAQRAGIKTVFFKSNQGTQEREGVKPDYVIYNFPELLGAIRFFERR